MGRILIVLVTLALITIPSGSSLAATETQKQAAINSGLSWLASQQQGSGYWNGGGSYFTPWATATAVLAYADEGHTTYSGTAYSANVQNAVNWIMSQTSMVGISPQPMGNPDTTMNGFGARFYAGSFDPTLTGAAVSALCRAVNPNATVTTGAFSGWTYGQVIQEMVDYLSYGQTDPALSLYRGGWAYSPNSSTYEMQYTSRDITVGLEDAASLGVPVPMFVTAELANYYVNNCRHASGAGMLGPQPGTVYSAASTGVLLDELDLIGAGPGDTRVNAALNYLNSQWNVSLDGSFYGGNFGNPWAMYSLYNGLSGTIGVDGVGPITNWHYAPGSIPLDPGDVQNWYEEYNQYLVSNQLGNGSWQQYWSFNPALTTAWSVIILGAEPIIDAVPEPITAIFFGTGLAGVFGFAARRRMIRK